jgi:inosose dehydratase
MFPSNATVAINPLQWFATADGWLDRSQGPDLPDLLKTIKESGFDAVHTLVPDGSTAAEYGQVIRESGLSLVPGTKAFTLPEDGVPLETTLDIYRKTAEQYSELGLQYLFIQNGMRKDALRVARAAAGVDFDQARLDRVVEIVTAIGSVVTEAGVLPILHPHVGTWIESGHEIRHVLDNVAPHLLGFGPDTGHLFWAGVDPAEISHEYSNRVFGIHVKDARRDVAERGKANGSTYQETVMDGLWVEPGRGDIDFDAVWDALPPGYSGCLVIEVDRGDIEPPLESVRACAAWAKAEATPA